MKRLMAKGCLVCTLFLLTSFPMAVFGAAGSVGTDVEVMDITKEVLTGPNDLDPKKVLGPGGIGIKTSKDLFMSFGATVRFIPTSESEWDFGLSKEVPGYFNTEPLKAFAGNSLTAVNSVQEIYNSTLALTDTIGNSRDDASVISSFDSFSNAYYNANEVLKDNPALGPSVGALASGMQRINETAASAVQAIAVPVSTPVADAAAVAAAAAAVQPGASLETIGAAAAAAAQATATVVVGAFEDPQQKAIAGASAAAAVSSAAGAAATTAASTAQIVYQQMIQAGMSPADAAAVAKTAAENAAKASAGNAAANAASDAAKATVIKGGVTTPNPALGNANLIQTSEALAAGVAQNATNNPNATASDISAASAKLTALKATADGFSPYALASSFLKVHNNEAGAVKDGYIRNETKMYFNAMPGDRKWSFYGALEFDRPIDTNTVDNRGGKESSSSNFGLERLNASYEIMDGLRFHAGWDVWGMDIIEAGSMVYGDDNPGFWIKGNYEPYDFSVAWLKLENNDFQTNAADLGAATDADRDLLAGYFDYKLREKDKVRVFGAWDRIRNVPALDLTGAIAAQAGLADYAGIYGNNGITGAEARTADTDAFTLGGYYLGNFGLFELMAEGAYKFGRADDTGLAGVDNGVFVIEHDDYDISAYALALDLGIELKEMTGWYSLRPHIGWMYTSGDDDPYDDKLGGWTGITSAQRFSSMWGGENTIIADANFVLGSALYGFIPEYHGNGTPVFTGGLQNAAGNGNGRGDNPGLNMFSLGLTLRPKIYFIYRTNVNIFSWNQDFYVANMVNPIGVSEDGTSLEKTRYSKVNSGYMGTEWDNEITMALSKYVFVKGQGSLFFPGDGVKEVTLAYSGGTEVDDIAYRLAAELIWNF